jgi:hypothetical protein
MGGTQILNTGSDWTAGSPMPPGRFMPSPSFQDGPQPVPGQPPQKFDPSQGQQPMPIDPGMGHTVNGSDPIWPGGPSWDQLKQQNGGFLYGGNRGSGQPINQPMATSQPLPWDGSGGQSSMGGSLQSLGGGQLNQSGMVTLRAPDGSQTKAVPADQVAHWLSRGAVRV